MKKALLLIMTELVVVLCMAGCGGRSSSGDNQSTSQSVEQTKQEPVNYAEAYIDVLINDVQNNAAKANKNYKGKNVKITGGHVSVIESEGRYIVIKGSDQFNLLQVQCYPKNKDVKAAILELDKDQPITVYGKIKDVGEIMGYSLDLVKIE